MESDKEFTISSEFKKLIVDFVKDVQTTFPEYTMILNKYFYGKLEVDFEKDLIDEEVYPKVFQFLRKKYTTSMIDICCENASIFDEESSVDTEFLPNVSFKHLWNSDISETTKKTLWKYLQIVLFMVVEKMEGVNTFEKVSEMFETCNKDNLQSDIETMMPQLQELFDSLPSKETDSESTESEKPFAKMDDLFKGKLGEIASDIAENISKKLDMDEISKDPQKAFSEMLSNPAQFTGLMKDISTQMDEKIKSGDVKESELISEAMQMLNNLKSVPGMDSLQSLFGNMAKNYTNGTKVNKKATEENLKRQLHMSKIRESLKSKAEKKQQASVSNIHLENPPKVKLSDDEIVSMFETPKKSKKSQKKDKNKV